MTQQITKAQLNAKIERLNQELGVTPSAWNVIGSFHLYGAYGATSVHRVVNTSGGVDQLMPLRTKREVGLFLDGMLTALRLSN